MKRVSLPILAFMLTLVFSMYYYSNQSFELLKDKDFNEPEYWITHVYDPMTGMANISNGRLYLEINDTSGEWLYSRAQQGILPHRWGIARAPLEHELIFRRNIEAKPNACFLTVIVNRSELTFYNETSSQINAGFILWFDIDKGYEGSTAEDTVLDVCIRFLTAWYVNGSVSYHEREFARQGELLTEGDPRINYDYHVFMSAPTMLEDNGTYAFTIDLGSYMERAFGILRRDLGVSLQSAKLKDFDIFIEANYGHGAITVEYVNLEFKPQFESSYVIAQSGLNAIIAFVLILFLSSLTQRK